MIFQITVEQLCEDKDLDHDDFWDNPAGKRYMYEAEDEEKALDEFHSNIPIGCLDDFDVTCEVYKGSDRG